MGSIHIMSSSRDCVCGAEHMFDRLVKDSVDERRNIVKMYPEISRNKPVHPQELIERIESAANNCIDRNFDLYIFTFSDIVLHTLTKVSKDREYKNLNIHQVTADDGKLKDTKSVFQLDRYGIPHVAGVFDAYESCLNKLLGLDE